MDPDDDIEEARVRARVKQGLFGGARDPVRVDRFELLGQLGAGAMGVVYEAYDSELDRTVALKLLHPATDERAVGARTELLLEEARAMARVRHPNVVTVHQVGTHGTQVYVAMERVKGTLREWLERDRPTPARILEVMTAVGRGLAAVHRQGLVHRDFKLDNILMDDDGQPRVGDFGLVLRADPHAKARGEAAADPSRLVGTPAYMSPEQLRGELVDARSDQWSYCVTAVEAFSGQRPFRADTTEALLETMLRRVKDADLAGVPAGPLRVFRRGLEPEPSARFPSMDALLEQLEGVGATKSRGPALLAAVAIGCVLIVGAVIAMRGDPTESATTASAALAPTSVSSASIRDVDITRLCRAAVRASSERGEHPAAHAFDGMPGTAWTESENGDGVGAWVEAELRPGTWVSSVEVSGGWSFKTASGLDLWQHNSSFRRMRVSWDGGEQVVEFDRARDRGKHKRVDVNATTTSIRITALEVDRGRFPDLCLDEVAILGRCQL